MTRLLGGSASPIGWSVQFVEAPLDATLAAVLRIHEPTPVKVSEPQPYPDALLSLPPFEAPWTRELLMQCASWTAYLNNGVDGGDSTAVAIAAARGMGVRCAMAEHTPTHGPGHAGTQLWLSGPEGVPPLMDIRTISATATDGRWEWHEFGAVQPFEDAARYQARRVRERFDRALLIDYLNALGIPADDDAAYGTGVLVQQVVEWPRRSVSLEEARRELAREDPTPPVTLGARLMQLFGSGRNRRRC